MKCSANCVNYNAWINSSNKLTEFCSHKGMDICDIPQEILNDCDKFDNTHKCLYDILKGKY